ncbi:hypothetical protein FACS1894161_2200 [Spirochaetia bacterium]|nr:hypothetical protein FACS1894161_2200 [Spirochaetia bacterium]
MKKIHSRAFTITIFLLTALGIGALLWLPSDFFSSTTENPVNQTRVVIPQSIDSGGNPAGFVENQNLEESSAARIPFNENELVISIITRDFDGDLLEEQIIAYRNLQELDTPVYIAYANVDAGGLYSRIWTAPTTVTRTSSLIMYSEDLIGDGGVCVLVSGMNGSGEQTLAVFRKNNFLFSEAAAEETFVKIAEFIIEGSIVVQEIQRSRDYQQVSQPLTISTYGRNYESANMLDQIETTYTYNPLSGLYEQVKMVKVPGSQIEQRRVSELLNAPGKFEEFIGGLWRLSTEDGRKQYVHFNPSKGEMIFYINNTEEVFGWQESNPTRYGLHIIGRNTSLSKLRCTVNIELESLDSIRVRVFQDAYLRTGPGAVWDGSYKKIQTLADGTGEKRVAPYLEGSYKTDEGGIVFSRDGSYELYGAGEKILHSGKYVFFNIGEDELLELRPSAPGNLSRQTLKVRSLENDGIALTRIRLGTRGIQELETPVSFTRVARN